jgi:hypothetical protein
VTLIKVEAFREIFADKVVDILDFTTLPWAILITQVNGDFGGTGEGGLLGLCKTVVLGEDLAQV